MGAAGSGVSFVGWPTRGGVKVVLRCWRVIVGLRVGGALLASGLRSGFFLLGALGSLAVCVDGLGLPRRPDPRLSYVRGAASRALLRRVAARSPLARRP